MDYATGEWSEEEMTVLFDNMDLPINTLCEVIPTRSMEGIARKKRRVLSAAYAADGKELEWPKDPEKREALIEIHKSQTPVIIPPSEKRVFDDNINLPGPSALGLFDIHLPYHDADFISRCVNYALSVGVDTCVIGGDLLDVAAFSKFGPDPEDIFEHELASAESFFNALAPAFKTVVYLLGNHEARFLGKAANRQIKSERFLRMFCNHANVKITSFEYITMDSPTGPWIWAHPRAASVVAGRIPVMLGRRYSKYHVVSGHGHLAAITKMEDGERFAVDSGTCAAAERIEYVMKGINPRPAMVQGAALVLDGKPTLLLPDNFPTERAA